ncbi:MAG: Asp-tRNA(Asn)/Glu-tRNA(Gln) amidotransferase subunit GatA [Chloroflexi bacterium]|nr:Asp-tRNA(Asn)/Glu-tRNA(Gln) amidotransferase subunit GatA [Chloroflexota bacterium]
MAAERLASRLALLEGVQLSEADLDSIVAEIEAYDQVLAVLEPFAEDVSWLDLPVPPPTPEPAPAPPEAEIQNPKSKIQNRGADLCALGLVDLSRLIAARTISSLDAVEAVLARLERLEPRLNAFITVLPEQARAAARQADAELARGQQRGPLHGVPLTIKDMFCTAGVRTTGGSKLLADWVPETDAALVERLQAAGAVLVGKTNQDEFGHGGTSTLSHFGPVHNPWHEERIAGGSSGGSAAAVAVGIGPLSYGTETGSSVRRPAAYCGIFGFKPTFGLISRYGSFRGAWSMDHVGVFARSVEDAALGLDAAAGYDPRDPASVYQGEPTYAARLEPRARGLRVGVVRAFLEDSGVDLSVRGAFEAALAVLAGLGAEVRDLELPELRYVAMTSLMTSSAEAAGNNLRWLRERADEYVAEVRRRLAAGLAITATEYLTVQRARHRIRQALRRAFEQVDLIAAPTTNRAAPPIADGPRGNGDQTYRPSSNQSNLLRLPSMLGLPACSTPCGADPAGLPLGLQLIGPWFADQRVLDAACAYEWSVVSGQWPVVG